MISEQTCVLSTWISTFVKSVDDMAFLDIMSCNIPNREVTIDDRDVPWITPEVKQAIKKNHRVFSKWKSKGKPDIGKNTVKAVNQDTNRMIEQAKQNYAEDLESKLCDPSTSSNIFWSVVNRLVSNKKSTNIPPILENGTLSPLLMRRLVYSTSILLLSVNRLLMAAHFPNFNHIHSRS